MKTIIMIACAVAIIFLAGGITVQFKPFKIAVPDWRLLIASVFFMGAIIFFRAHYRMKDYHQGVVDGIDLTFKRLEEKKVFNQACDLDE